jgi:hypothetical protein
LIFTVGKGCCDRSISKPTVPPYRFGVRHLPANRRRPALLWGAAVGVLDSSVKALAADLVPAPRRATADGLFAAVQEPQLSVVAS